MIAKLQNLNKKIVELYCYLLLLIYGFSFYYYCHFTSFYWCNRKFFPAIPGPPISYGALLLSHFYIFPLNDISDLWLWALIVVIVTILDFLVQIYGVKKFGGGKKAINGSILGLLLESFLYLVLD